MDPEVARMLADLGVSRRDVLSAPNEEIHGRAVREDPRAQQATLAQDEARRRRIREDGPATEEAAVLRAWNTESTFGSTGGDGGLENRYNGQGHRAALAARHHSDPRCEATEARVGEERRRYLQERDASRNANYTTTRGSPVRPHVTASTPRIVQVRDSPTRNPVEPHRPRPRPAPSFPTTRASQVGSGNPRTHSAGTSRARSSAITQIPRQRAPSPRSFGTTRFPPVGGGNRRASPHPGPRANTSVTSDTQHQPAPVPRASASSLHPGPRANTSVTPHTQRQPAPASRAPTPNHGGWGRSGGVVSPRTTTTVAAGSSASGIDGMRDTSMLYFQALWHVSHPTAYAHVYEEHPERLCYLDRARKEVAQDVVDASVSDRATANYLEMNEGAAWLIEAAKIARVDAREKTDEQNAAKYDGDPTLKYIFEAAKAAMTSNADAGRVAPVIASDDHQGTQQAPTSPPSAQPVSPTHSDQSAVTTIGPHTVAAAQPVGPTHSGQSAVTTIVPQTDAVSPTITAPPSVQPAHPMQSGQTAVTEDVAEPGAAPQSDHSPIDPSSTGTPIDVSSANTDPAVPRGRLTATLVDPNSGGTTTGQSSSVIDPVTPTVPRGRATTTFDTLSRVVPVVDHSFSTTNTAGPSLPRRRVRATFINPSSSDAVLDPPSSTTMSFAPPALLGGVSTASANLSSNNAASGRPVSTPDPAGPFIPHGAVTSTSANPFGNLFEQLGLSMLAPAGVGPSSETGLGRSGPLWLADSMSDLSQNMLDPTRGLSGVRTAEDGLCEWEYDLNEVDRFFQWPADFGI